MLKMFKHGLFAKALLLTVLLFMGTGLFAQGNKPEKADKTEKVKKEKKAKKEKKPKKGMSDTIVVINTVKSLSYTIKVGQKISYTYKEHGSVGIGATYEVDNSGVLVYKELIRDYKNKNREGLTGADEARVTLVFEGLAKGKAVLNVKDMYRGKVQSEAKITVTVE